MTEIPDNFQNFCSSFLGRQVRRPWLEQWKNPENILRKISPENFRRCKLFRVFIFADFFRRLFLEIKIRILRAEKKKNPSSMPFSLIEKNVFTLKPLSCHGNSSK
jgi:hypothetical protein